MTTTAASAVNRQSDGPEPRTATPIEVASKDRMPLADPRQRWKTAIVFLGLFALAVVLRVPLLTHHALWGDEAFSIATATGHSLEHPAAIADPARGDFVDRPVAMAPHELTRYVKLANGVINHSAIIRACRLSDTSPPLYYLLLAYWMKVFGTGDAGLRSFSMACALLAFPIIWSLAGEFGGRKARWPVMLLYAVTPVSVYLSTEGRMYSLIWLTAAMNLWATVWLSRREHKRPLAIALWVLTSIAGLYTHYFFSYVWVATIGWLLLYPGPTRRATIIGASLLVGAIALPWYIYLPADMQAWRVTEGWQKFEPFGHIPLLALLRLPFHYVSNNGAWRIIGPYETVNFLIYIALIVVVIRNGARALLSPRRRLLWAIAGAACLLLVSSDMVRGTYAYTFERYVTAGLPAALVLVGVAISRLPKRSQVVFTALVLFTAGLGLRQIYLMDGRQKHAINWVANDLRKKGTADDLVLLHAIPSAAINIARYIESPDGSHMPGASPNEAKLPRVATWVGQLEQQTVPDSIAAMTAGKRRVFYVQYHDVGAKQVDRLWLAKHGRQVDKYYISKIPVLIYEPLEGKETF